MNHKITDGMAVTFHYKLTLDDGSTVDNSFEGDPLVYVHGAGHLVPGLERELAGKARGDDDQVVVEPRDGYGEYDPNAEQTVLRTQFSPEIEILPGVSFQAEGPQGVRPMWIRKVEGEEVAVTTNHPLSGERLTFQVQVLDVQEASGEDLPAPDS
jgi:FKBP-type peptidyl-prolyl cis-trans isomerase SlyD